MGTLQGALSEAYKLECNEILSGFTSHWHTIWQAIKTEKDSIPTIELSKEELDCLFLAGLRRIESPYQPLDSCAEAENEPRLDARKSGRIQEERTEKRMVDLEGIVLISRDFGYCKVVSHIDQRLQIRFCGTSREAWYAVSVIAQQRDFKWLPLPVGLKCHVERVGDCTIIAAPFGVSDPIRGHVYTVEFDGDARETASLSERDLWPIPGSLKETPLTRVCALSVDPYPHFLAREGLLAGLRQLHRDTNGMQALAASRIDLLPHQTFVIGTVIDDPVWRYVLADEVGLGKTVEAGVIAHTLLAARPAARVLVLCPGPLSRQWLCEMHISFAGRDFHLLDLHSPSDVRWSSWTRVIASIKCATRDYQGAILKSRWDLVIVDEAHHLLWNDEQYDFVKQLSAAAGGLLLLSAVPVKEREHELLRLLQLIEPIRYANGTPVADRFLELYGAQSTIGRRLRILSRYLDDPIPVGVVQLRNAASRLVESPILAEATDLAQALKVIVDAPDLETVRERCFYIRDETVNRYRISRRILKNRRARLIDSALMSAVERRFTLVSYLPRPIEVEVTSCLQEIISLLAETSAQRSVLHAFFRIAMQAQCDPVAMFELATCLKSFADPAEGSILPSDLDGSIVFDYEEHDAVLEIVSTTLGPHLPSDIVDRFCELMGVWIDDDAKQPRVKALVQTIDGLRRKGANKIVVFAGTYGTAEFLVEKLSNNYGDPVVATFRHDLSDDAKEKEATRFRRDASCLILVCDESGGEGRNFQFANAVIHYDLPWSVAAIEQRIGRLDRIGRSEPVNSIVLFAKDSIEEAWVECLAEGFEVFRKSISGLEFMLRHTERKVIANAIAGGARGIAEIVAEVKIDSESERASDDADALTDSASFNESGRYLRTIQATTGTLLEDSFPRYLRALSVSSVAKQIADARDPNLQVWRLRPEDVSEVRLPGLERDGDNPLRQRYGTFSRTTARDRPDLEFFTTGHPLFDAVCSVAAVHVRGRTFAVRRPVEGDLPVGPYLYVGLRIVPGKPDSPDTELGRAERHLFGRRMHALVDLATTELVPEERAIRIIELHLNGKHSEVDIPKDVLVDLLTPYLDDWSVRIRRCLDVVNVHVEAEQRKRYAAADDAFLERIDKERLAARRVVNDDGKSLEVALFAVQQSVQRVSCELDTIGVLNLV